ncbi:ATP-grasp domain-containing protein [Halomonas profundus]|nr:ATP-grasp domain-containing protein [Halomonas profundus]
MKERLLFVAAGQAQASAIRDARSAGHYVVAMDGSTVASGLAEADQYRVANILDPDKIIEVFKETGSEAIVSISCEAAMEAVAIACKKLGISGIPLEAVQVSRNKLRQREIIRTAGLLTPRFRLVNTVDEAMQAWGDFQNEACIVKPVDASGSRGVSFVNSQQAVSTAMALAFENSLSGQALLETFIPGREYSVEAWVVDTEVHVLATSEKVRTDPPYMLDRQVHFPDFLTEERRKAMIDHAVKAIQACGFRNCPVHLECIDSEKGPMIVELSARGAGFKVFTEMLPRVAGLSTIKASIETALGKRPDLTLSPSLSAATLAFIDPEPGLFRAAHGIETARALPGVAEIEIYVTPGESLNTLRSGSDRVGHIVVYDTDPVTCRETAQKALDLIRLEVEAFS